MCIIDKLHTKRPEKKNQRANNSLTQFWLVIYKWNNLNHKDIVNDVFQKDFTVKKKKKKLMRDKIIGAASKRKSAKTYDRLSSVPAEFFTALLLFFWQC